MSLRFEHESYPQRVRFASNQAAAMVADEVERLGGRRVMVIAGDTGNAAAGGISGQTGG